MKIPNIMRIQVLLSKSLIFLILVLYFFGRNTWFEDLSEELTKYCCLGIIVLSIFDIYLTNTTIDQLEGNLTPSLNANQITNLLQKLQSTELTNKKD
jgi:hypothetical protein